MHATVSPRLGAAQLRQPSAPHISAATRSCDSPSPVQHTARIATRGHPDTAAMSSQTSVVVAPGSGDSGPVRRATKTKDALTMAILKEPHTCYGAFQ